MRLGISEISWTLPKILRMRRELVLSPLVVFRGASIALVAIVFPALELKLTQGKREPSSVLRPGPELSLERYPRSSSPIRLVRALFGPCPGEDGKSPGTHETVRRSRLFVG